MLSGESDVPEVLLERIKDRVAFCRENGLNRADFEREKKCVYASYVGDFDSTEDIAFALNSYAYDDVDMFKYPDIVGEITLEYVTELLGKMFKDEFFVLSAIMPEK
jgi:predicted Zn-dependent peptidase